MSDQSGSTARPILTIGNYDTWYDNFKAYAGTKDLWRQCKGEEAYPSPVDVAKKTRDERMDIEAYETRKSKASGEIWLAVSDTMKDDLRVVEGDPKKMMEVLDTNYNKKAPGIRFKAYNDFLNISLRPASSEILPKEVLPNLVSDVRSALSAIRRQRPTGFTIEKLEAELATMVALRALQRSNDSDHRNLANNFLQKENLDFSHIEDTIQRLFQSDPGEDNNDPTTLAMAAGSISCFICDGPHFVRDCPNLDKAKAYVKSDPPAPSTSHHSRGRGRGRGSASAATSDTQSASPSTPSTPPASASASAKRAVEYAGKASAFTSSAHRSDWFKSRASADWNTDTGASSHMTPHRSWFVSYSPHRIPIKLADDSIIFSEGIGSVEFRPSAGDEVVFFHDVLHVPNLASNLLSLYHLSRMKGYEIHVIGDKVSFSRSGKVIFTATVDGTNTGYLDGSVAVPEQVQSANGVSTLPSSHSLWHRRFSHLNYDDVRLVVKNKLVTGMKIQSSETPDPICEPCILGKQRRHNIPRHRPEGTDASCDSGRLSVLDDIYRRWIPLPSDRILKEEERCFCSHEGIQGVCGSRNGGALGVNAV